MEWEEFRKKMSVLSAYLDEKIDEKGMSVRELADKTGLSKGYLYSLISEKRTKTPSPDSLEKISDALEFSDDERKYIQDIADKERETGEIIYSDGQPTEPEPEDPDPAPEPDPEEPSEPEPDDPEPEDPDPEPDPDETKPDTTPWSNRAVITVIVVVFIAGLLLGCCSSSIIIPAIMEAMKPGW